MIDSDSNLKTGSGEEAVLVASADIFACLCACTALSVAFVDVLLALLMEPEGLPGFLVLLPPMGLLAAAMGIFFAVLYQAWGLARPCEERDLLLARSVTVGGFLLALFVLLWLTGMFSTSALAQAPLAGLLTFSLLGTLALCAGMGAGALVQRNTPTAESVVAVLRGVCLGTFGLGAAAVGLGLWLSEHGLSLVICLSAMVPFAFLVLRSNAAGVGRIPLLVLAVVVASPMATVFGWRESAPTSDLAADVPIRRIVLLTVDTLRRDSLTLYNPESTSATPAIDRLGEDSLIFEKAFSSAPWTVPAFVSLFSGLTPDVHGINEHFPTLPSEMQLLAQPLQAQGYLTAAMGNQIQLRHMNRGFDVFKVGPMPPPFHRLTIFGRLLNGKWSKNRWTSEGISSRANEWLRKNQEEDFFLWLHWLEPHLSYSPPEDLLSDSVLDSDLGRSFPATSRTLVQSGRLIRTEAERRWLRELYDAEVRYTDRVVGRVLDQLRELDLYKETLVIFTTDHGEEFWDHGGWEHGHSVYDELVSAPLLVKLPGESKSRRIKTPVSTAALFETILDLTGAKRSDQPLRAPSMARLWQEAEAVAAAPSVYIGGVAYFEAQEAMVFDQYKYVVRSDSQIEELYDLVQDPGETHSLVDEDPVLLDRGRSLLQAHRKRVQETQGQPPLKGPKRDKLGDEVESQLRALGYVE